MIDRKVLDGFFAGGPSRGIDFGRPLLWGYFFRDRDLAALERARPALEALGYRFVTVLGRPSGPPWFLHVERVEVHSASSLFDRYRDFDAFAREHALEAFDGFDVGTVDGSGFKRP